MPAGVIVLRLPGRLRYRDLAVRVVAAASKLVGTTEDESGPVHKYRDFDDKVVSAFGEAFNNIALHGYRDRPVGDVQVEIEIEVNRIEIRLLDDGASFELAEVPTPDLEGLPESGMGIFIVRSFMDEVSYQPGRPNVLRLTKSLAQKGAGKGGAGRANR